MFKKLLLAAIIGLALMWGAGYDFGKLKEDAMATSSEDAAFVNGRGGSNDWGN